MNDKEFLMWIHQRLNQVHGENKNVDYMWKLRAIIANTPEDKVTPNTMVNLTLTDEGIKITRLGEPIEPNPYDEFVKDHKEFK